MRRYIYAALSIAYGGVFHSHINALTLFLHCVNQCQLCGAYIHKYLNRKLSELQQLSWKFFYIMILVQANQRQFIFVVLWDINESSHCKTGQHNTKKILADLQLGVLKVRILDKHVGLISYCVLYRIEIDLLGIQSVGIATLNQSQ